VWLAKRFRLARGDWALKLGLHVLIAIGLAFIDRAVFEFIWMNATATPERPFSLKTFYQVLLRYFDYGFYIYFIILLLNHALEYYRRFQDEQLSASQLKAELAQAQLQALKMQLHPHFLFNTLNAIAVLIEEDPKAARAMLGQLSDLLRLTLENVETQEVPLRQELEFLDQYLRIQQTRFGERLAIRKAIDPATIEASVPYLILQPLVENAIRHGIAPRDAAGTVRIGASRSGDRLRLIVEDDGLGLAKDGRSQEGTGIGLGGTRARLQQLYAGRATFDLQPRVPTGAIATLDLPFHTSPIAADGAPA
jgi:LytS/YehU family sensor histidine kinase